MSTTEVPDQIDGALRDYSVSADAMRSGAPAHPVPTLTPTALRGLARFSLKFQAFTRTYAKAITRAMRPIATLGHRLGVAHMDAKSRRRHRARCHRCNPTANPRPLCINGDAYQRKVRSRRKRR